MGFERWVLMFFVRCMMFGMLVILNICLGDVRSGLFFLRIICL